jgi:hypothetical protein
MICGSSGSREVPEGITRRRQVKKQAEKPADWRRRLQRVSLGGIMVCWLLLGMRMNRAHAEAFGQSAHRPDERRWRDARAVGLLARALTYQAMVPLASPTSWMADGLGGINA